MDFFKCFWIPRRQAWVVAMCALFIVLPIPLIGILIKSISVLLFLFFMVAIGCGGWSIYKERQASLQHQRQSVLTQKEIRVEVVCQTPRAYRLKAINLDSLIVFDQEFSSLKGAIREVRGWLQQNPNLNYSLDPTIQETLLK